MEELMFSCKYFGLGVCHPDVSKHSVQDITKPGAQIPLRPTADEKERLDNICKECEYFEQKPI